jgi:type I restriction enzyme M protein
MVLNRAKAHPGEVLLANASQFFVKGRPKNELTDDYVGQVHTLFVNWESVEQQCVVIATEQIASNDYNLSPSRYVAGAGADEVLPLDEAVKLLREAEAERAKADAELWTVVAELGIE